MEYPYEFTRIIDVGRPWKEYNTTHIEHDWKEMPSQQNYTIRQPHICPVCGGNGLVPGGFYIQVSKQWSTGSLAPETCRSCKGTGIVWG